MLRKTTLALIAVAMLLMLPGTLAQDDKPTVAILRFGPMLNFSLLQDSMLLALRVSDLVSAAEAEAGLGVGHDLDGENVRIIVGDADFSFSNINLIIEQALDEGADALVTFSTPVTVAALNATLDMDDPPAVLFGSVYNPYESGIAQASCIKPANVSGVESVTLYKDIVPLLLLQNPDIKTIGTVYSSTETSGRLGAAEIVEVATELGLTVEQAGVTSLADLTTAAEGLVAKGVEALLIPSDLLTVAGLPTLMQVGVENSIPVFHSTGNTTNDGATVAAGVLKMGVEGRLLGAMLAGHLTGAMDISATAIASISGVTVGVDLDTAASQQVEISEALLARADMVTENDVTYGPLLMEWLLTFGLPEEQALAVAGAVAEAYAGGGILELDLPEELSAQLQQALAAQGEQADEAETMADLHCTDEIIAEQQAELDASE